MPSNRTIPLPRAAIGVAMLGDHRVAVLAGDDQAKAAYVVNLDDGSVVNSFGVTKEATGIVAVSDAGPLVFSIGRRSADGDVGALERWTTDGQKLGVAPLAGAALGLSTPSDGFAYALVATATAKTAVPVDLSRFETKPAVPLPSETTHLGSCRIGDKTLLIYDDRDNRVVVADARGGVLARSSVPAVAPACVGGHAQIVGISSTFASASVVVLTLPNLLQEAEIPASNNVVALLDSSASVLALNSSPEASSIETFRHESFETQTAQQ